MMNAKCESVPRPKHRNAVIPDGLELFYRHVSGKLYRLEMTKTVVHGIFGAVAKGDSALVLRYTLGVDMAVALFFKGFLAECGYLNVTLDYPAPTSIDPS
jgi:hypothetical protein